MIYSHECVTKFNECCICLAENRSVHKATHGDDIMVLPSAHRDTDYRRCQRRYTDNHDFMRQFQMILAIEIDDLTLMLGDFADLLQKFTGN